MLEYRFRDGRTLVERFVDLHRDLEPAEREMLLGWRDVVQGPFEVLRREGEALVAHNLVDELIYRVRSNAGTSVLRRMPRKSFLIARLVRVGDEWMFSGPTNVLRPSESDIAFQVAWSMSTSAPETAFRNPEKVARGWELQTEDRERFIRFFGSDLVVLPAHEVEQWMADYYSLANREARPGSDDVRAPAAPLPPDLDASETAGLIYDVVDGLGYYADFALVEAVFAEPELARKWMHRQRALDYARRQHRTVRPPAPGREGRREGERSVPAAVEAAAVRLDERWGRAVAYGQGRLLRARTTAEDHPDRREARLVRKAVTNDERWSGRRTPRGLGRRGMSRGMTPGMSSVFSLLDQSAQGRVASDRCW